MKVLDEANAFGRNNKKNSIFSVNFSYELPNLHK